METIERDLFTQYTFHGKYKLSSLPRIIRKFIAQYQYPRNPCFQISRNIFDMFKSYKTKMENIETFIGIEQSH